MLLGVEIIKCQQNQPMDGRNVPIVMLTLLFNKGLFSHHLTSQLKYRMLYSKNAVFVMQIVLLVIDMNSQYVTLITKDKRNLLPVMYMYPQP